MLAWCDILRASVGILYCLPRPQSSNLALRLKSPDELATGKKPDVSNFIAALGQLVAIHKDGAKASVCAPTAHLGYFIMPHGGCSMVRDLTTWRSFSTYHVKPISSSVYGITAQAIAVSQALNSSALRGPSGLGSASASAVTDSVRKLVGRGGLGRHAPPAWWPC